MTQQSYLTVSVHTLGRFMKLWVWAGILLVIVILCIFSDPVPQDPLYHHFVDQRMLLGTPHALNVLSNIAYLLVGILGCTLIGKRRDSVKGINMLYFVFFIGVLLTGFGSAYYHWSPDNTRLVWDRLPMTIGFMSLICIVVSERCSLSLGLTLFPWLLALGILCVVYWAWLDDLRPYYVVQYGMMLLLPILIWRFKGPGTFWLWLIISLYFIAKLLELWDLQVFNWSEGIISGHTLKHLVSAVGVMMVVIKIHTIKSHSKYEFTTKNIYKI